MMKTAEQVSGPCLMNETDNYNARRHLYSLFPGSSGDRRDEDCGGNSSRLFLTSGKASE